MSEVLDKLQHKLSQAGQALSLLDRIGGDVMWACDFCEVAEITEALEQLQQAISDAESTVEEQQSFLEDEVERCENEIARFEGELAENYG